jgi:hypothetical protein
MEFKEIIIIIVIVGGILAMIYNSYNKNEKLKAEYEEALKGNDKKVALEAGRKYYSSLRGNGKLTIYDEQAITNDLSTMNKE